MAVTYRNIVYTGDNQAFFQMLVKELQDLKSKVETQSSEISYLKGRVN